jgi:ABC-type branched-subunit amino acid transport system ATPase component
VLPVQRVSLSGLAPGIRQNVVSLVRTFQRAMIFPSLSVIDNIRAARTCAATSANAADTGRKPSAVTGLLQLAGLADMKAAPAGALPKGLLRMLGVLARVFHAGWCDMGWKWGEVPVG